MIVSRTALIAAVAFIATSAHAGVYLGVNAGITSSDFEDVEASNSRRFILGYQLPESPLSFEVAAVDLGTAEVEHMDVEIDMDGESFLIGFNTATTENQTTNIFLKGGLYKMDTKISGTFSDGYYLYQLDGNESSDGYVFTAGFDYSLSKSFYLTGELGGYGEVDYIVADESIMFYELGAKYKF